MLKNIVLGAAVVGTVLTGGVVVDTATAPDANAACYGSVSTWKGTNYTCGNGARHWDAIKNGNPKYGAWVGRGKVSSQLACWPNVVSYGMTAR
jgi:hypothetical protein